MTLQRFNKEANSIYKSLVKYDDVLDLNPYMDAKSEAYQTISTTGQLSQSDLHLSNYDSLGRNMLNVYLLGAGVYSSLVDKQYMTPLTAKNKQQKIERI